MTDAQARVLLERWRADTLGTADLIHLNNAGAALMPRPVIDAITDHIEREVHMGGYEAEAAVGSDVEAAYQALGTLVGAPARNIAIVENATTAFALALSTFDFRAGDAIVTSHNDYTSNQLMYLALRERQGVEVLRADDVPAGGVDPDSVRRLVRHPRCRLVALTWIPTNGGLIQRVEEVGAICREAGVPFVVDGCQAVGQVPVDVGRLGCDFMGATARKFLRGPRGIGFLYVSDAMLDGGRYPFPIDMRGAGLVDADRFELVATARRYENWETSCALVLGMGAAARYALEVDVAVGGARAIALAGRIRERLDGMPSARLVEPGERLSAIVTAAFDGWDGPRLAAALHERGINTTATTSGPGPFNAEGAAGVSMLRLSPHYYNTEDEITAALDAIEAIVG